MLTEEQRELVRILNQPHRVHNVLALFRSCEKAATLIQEQAAEIDKLKEAKPKPAPKRARNAKGQLKADDPSTPDVNEAWEGGKSPKSAD